MNVRSFLYGQDAAAEHGARVASRVNWGKFFAWFITFMLVTGTIVAGTYTIGQYPVQRAPGELLGPRAPV